MTPRYTPGYNATAVFRALADLFVVHEIPATPIGVCGHHHCFPVVTLVGANTLMMYEVCGNDRIQAMIARKSKKKLCTLTAITTMGFVHKEVRGGINHAHTIKEVMAIQILSILTNLP